MCVCWQQQRRKKIHVRGAESAHKPAVQLFTWTAPARRPAGAAGRPLFWPVFLLVEPALSTIVRFSAQYLPLLSLFLPSFATVQCFPGPLDGRSAGFSGRPGAAGRCRAPACISKPAPRHPRSSTPPRAQPARPNTGPPLVQSIFLAFAPFFHQATWTHTSHPAGERCGAARRGAAMARGVPRRGGGLRLRAPDPLLCANRRREKQGRTKRQ